MSEQRAGAGTPTARVDLIENLLQLEKEMGLGDPQEGKLVRFNPASEIGGANGLTAVVGKEPGRRYVIVSQDTKCPQLTIQAYMMRGYRIEKARPGGPRFFANAAALNDGDPLVSAFGGVLMSCTEAQWRVNQDCDPMTGVGQDRVAAMQRQVLSEGSPEVAEDDPIRGLSRHGRSGRPYVSVRAEVENGVETGNLQMRRRPESIDIDEI
jgi:hypothetical protein